jgi:hypothetical protein
MTFSNAAFPELKGAACNNHGYLDPEAWQPLDTNGYDAKLTEENQAAMFVCQNECPVRQQCLTVALETKQDYGIWGGTTANERRQYRRTGRNFAPVG